MLNTIVLKIFTTFQYQHFDRTEPFEKALDDVHLADYLRREHRLETRALSPCFADAPKEYGLILGFAGFSEVQLENAVEELSIGIRSFLRTSN